jgi:hypothetical protein
MSADLALIEETTQKFTYDFAVNGGVINPLMSLGTLPDNAVITDMWYDVVAGLTTGGATNVSLEIETVADTASGGEPVAAITAANAVWATPGLKGTTVNCWADPNGAITDVAEAAARAGTFIKTTALNLRVLLVGTGVSPANDLTAGRINIFVTYYISE